MNDFNAEQTLFQKKSAHTDELSSYIYFNKCRMGKGHINQLYKYIKNQQTNSAHQIKEV